EKDDQAGKPEDEPPNSSLHMPSPGERSGGPGARAVAGSHCSAELLPGNGLSTTITERETCHRKGRRYISHRDAASSGCRCDSEADSRIQNELPRVVRLLTHCAIGVVGPYADGSKTRGRIGVPQIVIDRRPGNGNELRVV